MKTADENYKRPLGNKAKHHILPSDDEQHFRLLADNIPNLAWMADPDGWIYWYNSQWYEYTGTSEQDMEGWGWQSVHDPAQLQNVLKRWQASIKTGKPFNMVFPLKGKDGLFRPFLTRIIPLKDSDGKIVRWFGTNTDISEQEAAHQDLIRAKTQVELMQGRLEDLFMQAPAMIAVLHGPNLVFELANPLYLKGVGRKEDIIGKSVRDAFPELVGEEILDILFTVYKTGEPFFGSEVPINIDLKNNGHPEEVFFTFVYQPVMDKKGGVYGVMTHAVDVTTHILARRRAEESEAQIRFMAESLPQKIFTADPSGKVDYFNSQWAEYTGVNLEKLMHEGVRQFVHPEDLTENMKDWQEAIRTGKPFSNQQRLRREDGQYRKHLSQVKAMRDNTGKIVRWFGSMTDIEDIIQTAARKEELEEQTVLLQEQRKQLIEINTAKDEFISLASHQLRTPATSVKQYIGMMLEGYVGALTPEQTNFLQRAYSGNERQIKIVNDLLKVAMVDAGKVKPKIVKVKIVPLIKTILDELATKLAERKQHLTFLCPDQTSVVYADNGLLRMALENLIDNAIKYTYEGKEIKIQLKKTKLKSDIVIQDEGVGISTDQLDKLFHKFSRLDNPLSVSAGGSGLGLYWVKRIVDLHNGSITVISKPDKGTTFTLTLPA